MTRYMIEVEVDEDVLRTVIKRDYYDRGETVEDEKEISLIDGIQNECGWLEQSGICCIDVRKKDDTD